MTHPALTIETFHAAEKRSAGQSYPVYMDNMAAIGVGSYHVSVDTHNRRIFSSTQNQHIDIKGNLGICQPVETFDLNKLKIALRRTQSGESDFPTFMKEIAEAGVHFYIADVVNRKVSYFGKPPNPPYEEAVPAANK